MRPRASGDRGGVSRGTRRDAATPPDRGASAGYSQGPGTLAVIDGNCTCAYATANFLANLRARAAEAMCLPSLPPCRIGCGQDIEPARALPRQQEVEGSGRRTATADPRG